LRLGTTNIRSIHILLLQTLEVEEIMTCPGNKKTVLDPVGNSKSPAI